MRERRPDLLYIGFPRCEGSAVIATQARMPAAATGREKHAGEIRKIRAPC